MTAEQRVLERSLPSWGARTSEFFELAVFALALMVFGFFLIPMSWTPALNADSGTAVSISMALAHGDARPLIDGLFPPIQTALYGAFALSGGLAYATAVPVLFSGLLALGLAAVALWYTRSLVTASLPLLFLLFSTTFWEQTGSLTFYPAFALLGFAGLFFGARYILEPAGRRSFAVVGAICLGASLYAFTTALLFLPIPGLLLLCYWGRQCLRRTFVFYLGTAAVSLPWFAWHLLVGGTHFYYHPLNWLVEKHLVVINDEFWGLPHESFADYVPTMLQLGFEDLLAAPIWLLVVLGIGHVFRRHGIRAGLFVLGCSAFFLASLAVIRPAPYGRYFYPVLPLAVGLATLGAHSISQAVPSPFKRTSLAAMALIVVGLALVSKPEAATYTEAQSLSAVRDSVAYKDIQAMAPLITDSKGIISRDSRMQVLLPDNRINTVFLIDEADYVTYLSWPSDEEVLAVLDRHDIGWLLLYKNAARWERDYNVWLERHYGLTPRHYVEAAKSESLRKVAEGDVYVLYQVLPGQ